MLWGILYLVIGALHVAYVVSKDSRYLLNEDSTTANMAWLFFAFLIWPLTYMYALGDSIERQKQERDKR